MGLSTFYVKVDQLDIDILHWYIVKHQLVDGNGNLLSRNLIVSNLVRDFVDNVAGKELLDCRGVVGGNDYLLNEFIVRQEFNEKLDKLMGDKNE